jgi:predicted DsbA family dithiol-disulfide isomerase
MKHAIAFNILSMCLLLVLISTGACQGQSKLDSMEKEITSGNPLLCDPVTGFCELPGTGKDSLSTGNTSAGTKKVKLIYFTDPICSSCWGIEPQLRKLKLEYGQNLEIEYHMGGLLPDWSYNSGGISKPSDVAHHWDEVSVHYDMPIDGDVWLEDPLDSSFPPSIAFKAAQLQDNEKALLFLREMREMVFLKKINITRWEHIAAAASSVGLQIEQFKADFEGRAKDLFEEDLRLSRAYGVRGFPTIFFFDDSENKEVVYGSRPYAQYEAAILKINPNSIKKEYEKDWNSLFTRFHSLTLREFSEISERTKEESLEILNQQTDLGLLVKFNTKNGSIWYRK